MSDITFEPKGGLLQSPGPGGNLDDSIQSVDSAGIFQSPSTSQRHRVSAAGGASSAPPREPLGPRPGGRETDALQPLRNRVKVESEVKAAGRGLFAGWLAGMAGAGIFGWLGAGALFAAVVASGPVGWGVAAVGAVMAGGIALSSGVGLGIGRRFGRKSGQLAAAALSPRQIAIDYAPGTKRFDDVARRAGIELDARRLSATDRALFRASLQRFLEQSSRASPPRPVGRETLERAVANLAGALSRFPGTERFQHLVGLLGAGNIEGLDERARSEVKAALVRVAERATSREKKASFRVLDNTAMVEVAQRAWGPDGHMFATLADRAGIDAQALSENDRERYGRELRGIVEGRAMLGRPMHGPLLDHIAQELLAAYGRDLPDVRAARDRAVAATETAMERLATGVWRDADVLDQLLAADLACRQYTDARVHQSELQNLRQKGDASYSLPASEDYQHDLDVIANEAAARLQQRPNMGGPALPAAARRTIDRDGQARRLLVASALLANDCRLDPSREVALIQADRRASPAAVLARMSGQLQGTLRAMAGGADGHHAGALDEAQAAIVTAVGERLSPQGRTRRLVETELRRQGLELRPQVPKIEGAMDGSRRAEFAAVRGRWQRGEPEPADDAELRNFRLALETYAAKKQDSDAAKARIQASPEYKAAMNWLYFFDGTPLDEEILEAVGVTQRRPLDAALSLMADGISTWQAAGTSQARALARAIQRDIGEAKAQQALGRELEDAAEDSDDSGSLAQDDGEELKDADA